MLFTSIKVLFGRGMNAKKLLCTAKMNITLTNSNRMLTLHLSLSILQYL